ncbi:MAG: response regulator transcription factor [Spirochaetota bacterium]
MVTYPSFADEIYPLTGEWEFWWGQFVDPTSERLPEPDGLISVPDVWNDWTYNGSRVGGQGFASYAQSVTLPPSTAELALFVPPASTAYRLYVDGELVAQSGSPGVNAEQSQPLYRIRTVRLRPQRRQMLIVAHVSNFHHRRGGLWRPIIIGTPEAMEVWTSLEVLYDLLLAGGLLLMVLYLTALYAVGPKDLAATTPLFAALFFLALSVRLLVTGQMIATRVFSELSWATQLRLEYTCAHVALASFVWLFHAAFPHRIPRWFVLPVSLYAGANLVVVLTIPLLLYSRWVPIYAISMNAAFLAVAMVMAGAALHREPDALAYFVGALLAVLSAVGEALQVSPLFASREMIPLSFLVRLTFGNVFHEQTVQAISIGGSLVVVFVTAAVVVLRTSRTLLSHVTHPEVPSLPVSPLESREAVERAAKLLARRYRVTSREFEIAGLVAQGMANADIATRLFVSVPTVKKHLYNLMRKTSVKNRHELTMLYLKSLHQDPDDAHFIPK